MPPHPLTLALAVSDTDAVLTPLAGQPTLTRWASSALVVVVAPEVDVAALAEWVAQVSWPPTTVITAGASGLAAAAAAVAGTNTDGDALTVDAAAVPCAWFDAASVAAAARILGGVVEVVGGAPPNPAYAPLTAAGAVGVFVPARASASVPAHDSVVLNAAVPSVHTHAAHLLGAYVLMHDGWGSVPADGIGAPETVAGMVATAATGFRGATHAEAARLPLSPAPVRTAASPYVTMSSMYGATGFTPPPPRVGRASALGVPPPPRKGRGEGGMRFGVGGKVVRLHGAL